MRNNDTVFNRYEQESSVDWIVDPLRGLSIQQIDEKAKKFLDEYMGEGGWFDARVFNWLWLQHIGPQSEAQKIEDLRLYAESQLWSFVRDKRWIDGVVWIKSKGTNIWVYFNSWGKDYLIDKLNWKADDASGNEHRERVLFFNHKISFLLEQVDTLSHIEAPLTLWWLVCNVAIENKDKDTEELFWGLYDHAKDLKKRITDPILLTESYKDTALQGWISSQTDPTLIWNKAIEKESRAANMLAARPYFEIWDQDNQVAWFYNQIHINPDGGYHLVDTSIQKLQDKIEALKSDPSQSAAYQELVKKQMELTKPWAFVVYWTSGIFTPIHERVHNMLDGSPYKQHLFKILTDYFEPKKSKMLAKYDKDPSYKQYINHIYSPEEAVCNLFSLRFAMEIFWIKDEQSKFITESMWTKFVYQTKILSNGPMKTSCMEIIGRIKKEFWDPMVDWVPYDLFFFDQIIANTDEDVQDKTRLW